MGIAGYFVLALSVASPGQEMEEVPNCGGMAVYTVAHHYQKDVSLQDVQSSLGDAAGKVEGHSLEQIGLAVRSSGLHVRSVRVTAETLEKLNCPSIMYVRPDKMGLDDEIGHFVVLQSITQDAVQILDLTHSPRPWFVPRESLFSAWDGECLEISDSPFLLPTAEIWRGTWGIAAVCAVIVLFRSLKIRPLRGRELAALCLMMCVIGCNESSYSSPTTKSTPLITFEEDAFSGGTVPRGPEAEVECRFVVGDKKLAIASIESGCGCIRPDEQLVGQELLPGTEHSFVVALDTVGRFAKTGGSLTVQTAPPSPEPIRCKVSVYVDAPPDLVGTVPVRVEATYGKTPVTAILLEHFRGDDRKPIKWDEKRSDLAGFSVVRTDFSTERNSPTVGSMAGTGSRDSFLWKLHRPGNLSLGRHSFELKLAWTNDSYPLQRIPIEVSVRHPVRLALERVFFGVVEQGTPRVVDVNITNWDAEKMEALQVESDNSHITTVLDSKTGNLRIRLSDLAPSGRLEASIHIKNDQQEPELKIPVTAVITDSQSTVSPSN